MRGNITRRGKASWRVKFDLDRDSSGERKVRYATVKGTRKQAEAELARLLDAATCLRTLRKTLRRALAFASSLQNPGAPPHAGRCFSCLARCSRMSGPCVDA